MWFKKAFVLVAWCLGAAATVAPAYAAESDVPRGQLPRNVVPEHYRLALTIDPREDRFQGDVRIAVRIAKPARRFFLHGKDLEIATATFRGADGASIALKTRAVDVSGVLQVDAERTLPAGTGELRFEFKAAFGRKAKGTYVFTVDGDRYVMTQMEATGARQSFPSFDEPSFKTPWDVEITAPAAHEVVANTRAVATERLPGDVKRVRFATTEKLPTYLIAYAVGPWDVLVAEPVAPTAQRATPLPLRGLAVRGRGKDLAAALAATPEVVGALEEYFDSAYPFDKLDILASPEFASGAMENAGLITYRDEMLLIGADASIVQRRTFLEAHAHELAHQWFGNLVTMRWWDDLWLNEAFATWLASKIVTKLRPDYHIDRQYVRMRSWAFQKDALTTARQIREPIRDFTDIGAAFDSITYTKGGAVLSMFESYLGEARFRTAVRNYLRAHERSNATSADFIGALAAQSADASRTTRAFRTFLEQPGTPLVAATLDCTDGRAELAVRQTRYLRLGSDGDADRTWGIPLCVRYAVGDAVHKYCELVDKSRATLQLPLHGGVCPSFVMPNAGAAGYYRFALGPAEQRALTAHFGQLDALEQIAVAGELDAAFRVGKLGLSDLLATTRELARSPLRYVVTAPRTNLDWLADYRVGTPEERTALEQFVVTHYGPVFDALGFDDRDGEDDETKLMRTMLASMLADLGNSAPVRRELAARARRYLGLDGRPADAGALTTDLRGLALMVLIQDGGATEFDAVDARVRASSDGNVRYDGLFALGTARDPALQERALALAFDPGVQATEVMAGLYATTLSEDTFERARAWLRANANRLLARIPANHAAYLPSLDGALACSAAAAVDIEQFWHERMRELDGGPRALAQVVEATQLCGALKAHYAGEDLLAAVSAVNAGAVAGATPAAKDRAAPAAKAP